MAEVNAEGPIATGPHVLRQMNVAAVLTALRQRSPAAARVAELVTATGLSRPAVSRALGELRTRGLVEPAVEPDDGMPQLGRPAQSLRFRADLGHVAGIEIGPYETRVVIADLAGQVLISNRAAVVPGTTGSAFHTLAESALLTAAGEARVSPDGLWAITVGTPGIVDRDRGEVLLAPSMPGWAQVPAARMLEERFGCPVHVENDVNLAVLAERWQGAAVHSDSLVFVQWGERIGTSIVIDGKPYRGASSAAGELGFVDVVTPLDAPVPDRTGDAMGPFEELAGATAIHRLAVAAGAPAGDEHDLAPLFTAAAAGEPAALAVLDRAAARFARGLATLLLVLDPGLVVVGGSVSRAGDALFEPVRRHLAGQALAPLELRISELGERAVVLGAVRHSLDAAEERLNARASG